MEFELLTKPAFTDQLLGLPHEQAVNVNKHISQVLLRDPRPDGSTKKKLVDCYS